MKKIKPMPKRLRLKFVKIIEEMKYCFSPAEIQEMLNELVGSKDKPDF